MLKRKSLFNRLCFGRLRPILMALALIIGFLGMTTLPAHAQSAAGGISSTDGKVGPVPPAQHSAGGEANLHLPDLNSASFFHDAIGGRTLLTYGLIVCVVGVVFGLVIYMRLKKMAV
ncbi:MAG TPA: hypothetical protein VGN88_07265, partial [Phycisphaerae bacterium]